MSSTEHHLLNQNPISQDAITTHPSNSSSPPAFLDLADSAARLSSNLPDINARVEQKRIEHERLRSHHRKIFEEQMRALEEQQLAEERALLGANGAANASNPLAFRGQQPGFGSAVAAQAAPGFALGPNSAVGIGAGIHHGVALSAPTTPPSATTNSLIGSGDAIYTVSNGNPGLNGLASNSSPISTTGGYHHSTSPSNPSNNLSTPINTSSNPLDSGATSTFAPAPGVIGSGTLSAQQKRKSVNITQSPSEIIPSTSPSSAIGSNSGNFNPPLSALEYGSGNGGQTPFNVYSNGINQSGSVPYGHGARSMPASRRGSSGSKDGADNVNGGPGSITPGAMLSSGGDSLISGLAQLQIGGTATNNLSVGSENLMRAGTMPGAIGSDNRFPNANGSATGADASYLWDEDLEREMQYSLRHLPTDESQNQFALRQTDHASNNPSSDPFSGRKLSVSSAALDLAAPLSLSQQSNSRTSSASYLLSARGYHHPGGAEWPLFAGRSAGAGAAFGGAGGLSGMNGMGGQGGMGALVRAGGAVTAGNGTPVLGGTPVMAPSHTLGSAAPISAPASEGSPAGMQASLTGSQAANGNAISASKVATGNTSSLNAGLGVIGLSPIEPRGGSPAAGGANGLGSTLGVGNNSAAGNNAYMMLGARSVPATPLSTIPPVSVVPAGLQTAAGVLKGTTGLPVGMDVQPGYTDLGGYSTPTTAGPNGVGGSSVGAQRTPGAVATPGGMYEPIAFGSITGTPGEDYGNANQATFDGDAVQNNMGYMGYSQQAQQQGVPPPHPYQMMGMGMQSQQLGEYAGARNGRPVSVGDSSGISRPGSAAVQGLHPSAAGLGRFGGVRVASGMSATSAASSGGSAHDGTAGGSGSKMGGLHGPKHKRSDLDHNRFAGTHLEDLQGEIAAMCKDQHGCRYLQKKLEEGVPEHRDMIFRETFPHFAELMTDPFGNYLCQKLLEYSTDEQRNSICQSVAQDLVTISLNMHGTRAVQKMIDFLSTSRQTDQRCNAQIHSIIVALSMHVVTLIKDLNGNHVVQKCLNKLAPEDNQFIYNARCVDHASDAQRVQLVTEITYHALTLVQDPYGNYVVQYILDLNDNRFSDAVIRQFLGNVCALSVQKFSSNVIEKCIRVAEHNTRKMLIEELLNRTRLEKLLRDSFGNYCVQTALDYAEPNQRAVLVEYIRPILPLIRNTPYGKRIQSKLQREQVEVPHMTHYGVPGYHVTTAANHAALLALANSGLAAAVATGASGRHLHQQTLHHASQLVDPYVNQSPHYSHALPPHPSAGLHAQTHLHGVPPPQHQLDTGYATHHVLPRNGSAAAAAASLIGNGGFAGYTGSPAGGMNGGFGVGLGMGAPPATATSAAAGPEHYHHPSRTTYGYGM
ncbi:hypothetical protein FRB99_008144 [Tulasnella sp. 403]|nr:hypothetical protein FRB99_008144 [Tulasnella sp. 403]